jgi:c-di-GMP-binding flagellar brake protein YcgR
MEGHAVITATFAGSNLFFNTAFINIDPDKGILVIDELKPNTGHDLLTNAQCITLQTANGGVEINFTVDLKNSGSDNGVAFFELEYPESIRYLQRRNSFRVPVSGANKIDVEINSGNKNIITGELSDISAEGMCIRLPKRKNIPLDDYPAELQCVIRLPKKQQIKCAFKVCRSAVNDETNIVHIGGHFERIDKIQRRAIERFVIELQRESRKKMTR